MDFVEICTICTRKVIIKAAKRIFNSDKIFRSYCDLYFGVTFLEHTVVETEAVYSQLEKISVSPDDISHIMLIEMAYYLAAPLAGIIKSLLSLGIVGPSSGLSNLIVSRGRIIFQNVSAGRMS